LREEWRHRGGQRELLLQVRGKRAAERLCEGFEVREGMGRSTSDGRGRCEGGELL
jgi:hypothetical protein